MLICNVERAWNKIDSNTHAHRTLSQKFSWKNWQPQQQQQQQKHSNYNNKQQQHQIHRKSIQTKCTIERTNERMKQKLKSSTKTTSKKRKKSVSFAFDQQTNNGNNNNNNSSKQWKRRATFSHRSMRRQQGAYVKSVSYAWSQHRMWPTSSVYFSIRSCNFPFFFLLPLMRTVIRIRYNQTECECFFLYHAATQFSSIVFIKIV